MAGAAAATNPLSGFSVAQYETYQAFQGVFFGQPVAANASSLISCTIAIKGVLNFDVRRFGFRKVNSVVPPYI